MDMKVVRRALKLAFFVEALCLPVFGQQLIISFDGNNEDVRFGEVMQMIPDVNGNGAADLVVGDPGYSNSRGRVAVCDGLTGTELTWINGAASDKSFGWSLSVSGDVNQDGVADLVVGAYRATPQGVAESGRAVVYSGADWSVLYSFDGDEVNGEFGYAVAIVGDVNLDGHDDILIGEPRDDTNGSSAGAAHLYSGADGSLIRSMYGDSSGDSFGRALCRLGDLDGDSVDDYAVSAPLDDNVVANSGSVRVFSGASGSFLVFAINGTLANDNFGTVVGRMDDINGDGMNELIIGSPESDAGGENSGAVQVRSGVDMTVLLELRGASTYQRFGYSVADVGDYNGDGVADVGVGSFGPEQYEVFSGSNGELISNRLTNSDWFGRACCGGLDVNGDGLDDFAVGQPRFGGIVYVYAGQQSLGASYCTSTVNTTGQRGRLSATGSSSLGGAGLLLTADGLPASTPALFFYGSSTQATPFGYGFLCASGVLVRLNPPTTADGAGQASRLVDLDSPASAGGVLTPGDVYFQCWYRDPLAGAPAFNLTDAIRLTVGP